MRSTTAGRPTTPRATSLASSRSCPAATPELAYGFTAPPTASRGSFRARPTRSLRILANQTAAPASQAAVRAHDVWVRFGDEPAAGHSVADVVGRLRGDV